LAFVTDAWWAVILGLLGALVGVYLCAAILVGFTENDHLPHRGESGRRNSVLEALNSRPAFVVIVAVVSAVVIAFAFMGVSYLVLWVFLAFVGVAVFIVAYLNARRST
jgi:ABC-type antimicrobial peptide transport system permease subunit